MTYSFDRPASHAGSLRLSQNENTAGCSPAVLQAIHAVTGKDVALYPDYTAATAAVAARLGVSIDEVQLTNGLDEGILLASLVALKNPRGCRCLLGICSTSVDGKGGGCADRRDGCYQEMTAIEAFFRFVRHDGSPLWFEKLH